MSVVGACRDKVGDVIQGGRASKILGVHLAIVVDNKDGDGNPGFRVKLKLPWLNDQETTHWARIAVPMAGPERGTYVLAEIDDQVLVVFEHGDIGRPIVVGALWSRKQEPVEINQSGKNNTKLIKSRGGHRIIFDDKEGAEKIIVVDKTRKNKIILDSVNKIVKVESDGDIEVKAKANVVLHSNALKVGTREGITGKAALLLAHSGTTFGLKATSGITIGGGSTTINTSNAAACSVSGSGAGELGAPGAEAPKDQIEAKNGGGSGGGGGGARSAGGTAAGTTSGAGATGSGPTPTPIDAPVTPSTLIIELKMEDGSPAAFRRYSIITPDGQNRNGMLDGNGIIRFDDISPGDCQVSFPDLDGLEWRPS
jgi:hypothetical protein